MLKTMNAHIRSDFRNAKQFMKLFTSKYRYGYHIAHTQTTPYNH